MFPCRKTWSHLPEEKKKQKKCGQNISQTENTKRMYFFPATRIKIWGILQHVFAELFSSVAGKSCYCNLWPIMHDPWPPTSDPSDLMTHDPRLMTHGSWPLAWHTTISTHWTLTSARLLDLESRPFTKSAYKKIRTQGFRGESLPMEY